MDGGVRVPPGPHPEEDAYQPEDKRDNMSLENEDVARRFFDELWNQGRLRVAEELIAADHVHHVGGDVLGGPDGVKGAVTWLRTAFPDLRFEINDLISDRDLVAVRWNASGTHLGQFDDLQPTGRRVQWAGADWLRLRDGQIREVWAFPDGALHDQLVDEPEPPTR
jgi:predicted ester cyclase